MCQFYSVFIWEGNNQPERAALVSHLGNCTDAHVQGGEDTQYSKAWIFFFFYTSFIFIFILKSQNFTPIYFILYILFILRQIVFKHV